MDFCIEFVDCDQLPPLCDEKSISAKIDGIRHASASVYVYVSVSVSVSASVSASRLKTFFQKSLFM